LDDSPRELVVRARKRDEAAFAELIRRFERIALAIAFSVIGDASAAGDVTQEAFIRVWQRLNELTEPDRFGAWLARIVRNLATDQVRRRPLKTLAIVESDRHVADPNRDVDRSETRRGIYAALMQLDELSRSIVVLRYYQGMASKEIAEVLEMSPASVDMRLSRARTELREKLAWLDPSERCKT
jgi:RNA polymerase sigma factor (sigma-70 family)